MLQPCPCGKTPTRLHVQSEGVKWAQAAGDCCGEWMIEFRTDYHALQSSECQALAVAAWNDATRGWLGMT